MAPSKIGSSHEYTKFVLQINDKLSSLFNRRKREKLKITNPFVYLWNIPWYQWIKMAFLSIILLPIRLILLAICFSMALIISYVATNNFQENIPMNGWRKKFLMPLFYVFARLTFFWGGLQWIKVKGTRSAKEYVPLLVIAPHSAFLDSLIVVYLGMNTVLAKLETSKSFVGCLLKMTQPILVNREDPDSRLKTMDEIERRCKNPNDWNQIIIFPEGTCTNRSCLIEFKTGAFRCGMPVQPVLLRWPNKVDSVTWTWEGPGIMTLLWMCLTQFHTFLEIEFLPPYFPSVEEKQNPKLFSCNVRDFMAKELNIPTTNYTYADCRHMTMAKSAGLPFSEIVVEMNNLCKHLMDKYQHENNTLTFLLDVNQSISSKKATYKELCNKLEIHGYFRQSFESIFKFYDKTKTGSIYLRELLSHLAFFIYFYNRKKALAYSVQAYKDSMMLDESTACNDVLRHVFVLTLDEVNEMFSLIQSNSPSNANTTSLNNSINIDSVEETMSMLGGPFNMYIDYFAQYNRSKRQNQTYSATTTSNYTAATTTPLV